MTQLKPSYIFLSSIRDNYLMLCSLNVNSYWWVENLLRFLLGRWTGYFKLWKRKGREGRLLKPEAASLLVSLPHECCCYDYALTRSFLQTHSSPGEEPASVQAVEWRTLELHQFTTALRFVLTKLEKQAQTFAPGLCLITAGGLFLFFSTISFLMVTTWIFQLFQLVSFLLST